MAPSKVEAYEPMSVPPDAPASDAAAEAPADGPLRLIAFDEEDLIIVSAHLEGADVRFADTAWRAAEHRFVLVANRRDRLCTDGRRCLTGLHVERALSVRHHGLDPDASGADRLQTIVFRPAEEAPAGSVLFCFEEGGVIRVDVECLEVAMSDFALPDVALPDAEAVP